MNLSRLDDRFYPDELEWRVQQSGTGKKGIWAKVLAYVTNRAIQERLDEVCGKANWRNEYKEGPDGGTLCGISIRCGEEWITKWDGAENTQVEAVKGGLSSAMKRAAVQWGIGRYLYDLEVMWANVHDKGTNKSKDSKSGKYYNWDPPRLPGWASPEERKSAQQAPSRGTQQQQTRKPEPAPKTESKFVDLAKARQDKARAKLFAYANELDVDPYEFCADQLAHDPKKGRPSLGASSVQQVSSAISFLGAELEKRRNSKGLQVSEATRQAATVGGAIDPTIYDNLNPKPEWVDLDDKSFRKKLMDVVKESDIRLHAVFSDAYLSRDEAGLSIKVPAGYEWHAEKLAEGAPFLTKLTGMSVSVEVLSEAVSA